MVSSLALAHEAQFGLVCGVWYLLKPQTQTVTGWPSGLWMFDVVHQPSKSSLIIFSLPPTSREVLDSSILCKHYALLKQGYQGLWRWPYTLWRSCVC